jgi:hypothetical protein
MVQAVACRAALYGFNSHPQLFFRTPSFWAMNPLFWSIMDLSSFSLSFSYCYFLFLNRLSFSILQPKSNPATITSLVLVADETKRKVMELFGVRPPVSPNWVGEGCLS